MKCYVDKLLDNKRLSICWANINNDQRLNLTIQKYDLNTNKNSVIKS